MATQYLYIARERDRSALLKVGQTTRTPAVRRTGLRGQADTDFEMLRVYPTADALTAESLAKAMLDARGARQGRNSRRELFAIELAQAEAICAKAARQADKLSDARPSNRQKGCLAHYRLSAPSRLWTEMFGLPVRYAGKLMGLGDLMALALEEAPAARRLERFGIQCCAFRIQCPQFRIDWTNAALREWRTQRGLSALHCANDVEQVSFQRTPR